MTHWLEQGLAALLALLSIPQYGLGAVFLIAFVSATLLPMGSEPAVFGLVKLRPDLFWQVMAVATLGNTLGGAVTWWMGRAAHLAADSWQAHHPSAAAGQKKAHRAALWWLERFGAPACLLSWLPVVGDPLCAVAGWLRLPFWPCVAYMAVGKLGRYLVMTLFMQWAIT